MYVVLFIRGRLTSIKEGVSILIGMIINKKMEKRTTQKQIILDYLQEVKTHPTAEEVYRSVKKKLPRISLATIYRNLELFSRKRLVQKIQGEIKRFDGDISDHQHFVCNDCNKVFDIFEKFSNIEKISKEVSKIGSVNNTQFYLYGSCKKCQKKS